MKRTNFKKENFIESLSIKKGFSFSFSKKIVQDLLNILNEQIKSGQLNLKNVGSFKIINKKERLGRNPLTKKSYIIEARKTVSFKIANQLKKSINKANE